MGKAKSEKQKSRERSSAKELLILEAVRLYEVTNAAATRPEETIGYRTAALEVEKAARNKTRGPVPHINFRTVINRHKNCHRSQTESSFEDGAHMTRDQECVLCTYALEIANRGFPLNARCVEECANAILGANDASFPGVSVGTSWAKRFLQRHHEALGTYWSRNLENVWGQAVNPINIKMFYDILGIQYEKCDFKPWNIYGGDESGLMSGIAQKEKVIGGKGKKVQHQKRQTNRENTTVITTICADGTYLLPIVIFKGKHYQVRWGGQENPLSASVGYSEKGWTDGEIGLEWVKDFDRRTKDKAQGEWRLLLVDGHNSHYTLELLEYAINNNIVILCYPAHTTHVLQGLDVAVFGSFKVFWQQETLSFEMTTGQKVAKDNFLGPLLVGRAWVNAFTEDTIRAAFSKTGIYPFNRDAISDDQMAPSKETSILAHLPVAVSTPVRKLAEGVAVTRVLSSPGSSPKQLINVFYTPTKTRSLPIDPALLAQAELQRGIQQQPELSFPHFFLPNPLLPSSSTNQLPNLLSTFPQYRNPTEPDPGDFTGRHPTESLA